jgi:2-haloacid dehalogenase
MGCSHLWRETKIDPSRKIALMDETSGSEQENYVTWWELMTRALDYALEYYGIDLDEETREEVIDAYDHLDPYEPSWESFERLQEAGYELYILSMATTTCSTGWQAIPARTSIWTG